jgi:hypothetical protein
MPVLILTLMAATLQMVPARAQDGNNLSRKEQMDESAKKIKALQQERIATLQQVVEQLTVMYQSGRVEFDEVVDAQLTLLEAELATAEKVTDRVTLYKNMVDLLKKDEALADARVQSARGTQPAALKIKARRLEAEIHLEQAQMIAGQEKSS